jgi:hypothetical protein
MEKYLYFRTQATLANDDASDDSFCVPLSSFLGMHPTADNQLKLFFIPQIRISGGIDNNQDFTNADSVIMVLRENNTHKAAMRNLVKAFNKASNFGSESSDSDFIVVGDDLEGTFIIPEFSSMGDIAIGAAFV